MNYKALIARINDKHRVETGSRPGDATELQQRAANIVGRAMNHAARRGQRKKGRWA